MMGRQHQQPEQLFYTFQLERHVPSDHLLRQIDAILDLTGHHRIRRGNNDGRTSADWHDPAASSQHNDGLPGRLRIVHRERRLLRLHRRQACAMKRIVLPQPPSQGRSGADAGEADCRNCAVKPKATSNPWTPTPGIKAYPLPSRFEFDLLGTYSPDCIADIRHVSEAEVGLCHISRRLRRSVLDC